ncbi:hypothetical protein AAG906_009453 [Vitis piasezkii]
MPLNLVGLHLRCWIENENQLIGDNETSENNARAMYSIFNVISTRMNSAWDILQMTHEGTNVVKVSKLQIKSHAIEESKDVDSLKVDELMGSLQTFEMTLGSPRKSKGIALNAIKEESLGSEGEAFMASVIDEPLKKEALSESCESSDSNGDEMSFDSTYETLYKECLSLKQEQVEWKASKRSLINEIKTLKGEKNLC